MKSIPLLQNTAQLSCRFEKDQEVKDKIRYLYQDTIEMQRVQKASSLLSTIETSLLEKGITSEKLKMITLQEKAIIQLIAQGLQTKEIANQLFISHHTVQTHRKNIYKKLHINALADIVKTALYLEIL